ncbi:ABC transporter substrate-binding protein [Macrococcus equi]|uniref:ABC transporter substrate-binding protein n=1 Tax=Macrococcus equi TaxID=3395462 RepID=UPI0039BE9AD0
MVDVDEKLFKLYLYIQSNAFSREAVSDFLEISPRQLTRLLNKWSDDGFIVFSSGVGRGNATDIQFLKNIEGEYINHLIRNLEDYDVHQLQSIMALNMSENSKRILRVCIEEILYSRRDYSIRHFNFVDYLYRIPDKIYPLEPFDIALTTVLANVGERLYDMDGKEIIKNLVVYDEWIDNDLIIHLHKDIHFSNGDLMFADNVVEVLNALIEAKGNLPGLCDVVEVKAIDIFKLKIKMRHRSDMIKLILCQDFATIYKLKAGKILYSGPYIVHALKPDILTLKINPYFTEKIPDITEVWLINDTAQYQEFVQRKEMKVEYTKDSYGMDFLLFNPNSDLTMEQRKRLGRILLGEETPEFFIDGLSLLAIKDSRNAVKEAIIKLKQCVHNFKLIEVSMEEYIAKPLKAYSADVVIMNESLPMERKFFDLLLGDKFAEWMEDFEESHHLKYIYQHKHAAYWPYIEKQYEAFLVDNGFIVIIEYFGKNILTMDSFKDYEVNAYGIVKYNSIISVEEEKL